MSWLYTPISLSGIHAIMSGMELHKALTTSFPQTVIKPFFWNIAPTAGDVIYGLFPVILPALGAYALFAYLKKVFSTGKVILITVITLFFQAIITWYTLFALSDNFFANHLIVTHEGNSARTLGLLFHLFHSEPFRTSMVTLFRYFFAPESLPPVLIIARLNLFAILSALLWLLVLGHLIGKRILFFALTAVFALFSPAFAIYVISDNQVAFMSLYVVWTAISLYLAVIAWDLRLYRYMNLLLFMGFQVLIADLRPEYILIFIPADLTLLTALILRRHPQSMITQWSGAIAEWWDSLSLSDYRLWLLTGLLVLVTGLSFLLVGFPFHIFTHPMVSQYFPFWLFTIFQGLFVPGFIRLGSFMSPPLIIITTCGLLWGLARPMRTYGTGWAIAALLSAHFYLSMSHNTYQFLRCTVPMIPFLILLAADAYEHISKKSGVVFMALLAGLFIASIFGTQGTGPAAGWLPGQPNPMSHLDSPQEADFALNHLRSNPGECLVAPVLGTESHFNIDVPATSRLMNIMIMRRGFADLLLTRFPLDAPKPILNTMQKVLAKCGGGMVYLSLDCSLHGMDGCKGLRQHLMPVKQKTITGAQQTSPTAYGLRLKPQKIGVFQLAP